MGTKTTYDQTPNMTGFLGLNTIPNARMDTSGNIRLGISTSDPYMHSYIGVQATPFLFLNLRQTAETSNIIKKADHLYPGIDTKIRLMREGTYTPDISIGLQSAFGHKRMSGEFLAMSKRHNNFDFTLGIGWGRFGTAGHFRNPLRAISHHFDTRRDTLSPSPNEPSDWFTGETVGLFGGVEYFTPIDGLSIKADYGADHYIDEKASFGFTPAVPWSIGLSYSPTSWLNAGIAANGTDRIMGRLSVQSNPNKWSFEHKKYTETKPAYKQRPKTNQIPKIRADAQNDDIDLTDISTAEHTIYANQEIPSLSPSPKELGRAIRHISNNSAYGIEEMVITPTKSGLTGTPIKIVRSDFENAVRQSNGSPNEIWLNTEFGQNKSQKNLAKSSHNSTYKKTQFSLHLINDLSLAEEDHGFLYRSAIISKFTMPSFLGIQSGLSIRTHLKDNLEKIDTYRSRSSAPVHGDIDDFTSQRFSIENAYIGYNHSFTPALHASITAGHLDESNAGIGGELLYRPFDSRLAFGADLWRVSHRLGGSLMNAGLRGDAQITGHASIWYDPPHYDTTFKAQAGHFLGGDSGLTFAIQKYFENGAKLTADISVSNQADYGLFGGTSNTYHRVSLTLPIGSARYIPNESTIKTNIASIGRDTAQSLNKPIDLYEMTENMSLRHIAKHWHEITD